MTALLTATYGPAYGRLSVVRADTKWSGLAEELIAGIADGTYPVGRALPSITAIIRSREDQRISRRTVQKAIGYLAELGLVEVRPSSGTVVIARPEKDGPPTPLRAVVRRMDELERRMDAIERRLD